MFLVCRTSQSESCWRTGTMSSRLVSCLRFFTRRSGGQLTLPTEFLLSVLQMFRRGNVTSISSGKWVFCLSVKYLWVLWSHVSDWRSAHTHSAVLTFDLNLHFMLWSQAKPLWWSCHVIILLCYFYVKHTENLEDFSCYCFWFLFFSFLWIIPLSWRNKNMLKNCH